MPLVRLELRNEYGLGDAALYRNADAWKEGTKAILEGVAVSGLVGILRQLGDVAEFAAEIFHGLHEQVMMTNARGQKMLFRISKIEEAFPSIEDALCRKGSCIDVAYGTGTAWHADLRSTNTLLSGNDLPQFMMDSYEKCREPPPLYQLDKYDTAGTGACLKRYSDPSYFKRAWATSKPEKAQQSKEEEKLQKIKREYPRLSEEVHDPLSTSQYNSLASSARFAPHCNDDNILLADENSSEFEDRLKTDVISQSQLLNTTNKLSFTGLIFETNRLLGSVSNIENNQDQYNTSLHDDELICGVDDVCQSDFLHRKSTSQSPSVIWDEKFEFVKGLKFSDGTHASMLLPADHYSSEIEEPAGPEFLSQATSLPIIADLSTLSCDKYKFDEDNCAENYVDAHNTLESEAETDSECQTKCNHSISSLPHQQNVSGVANITQSYSCIEAMLPLDSQDRCMLSSDTCLDVSSMPEFTQTTQEAGISADRPFHGGQLCNKTVLTMSGTNALQRADDDHPFLSTDAESESVLNCETTAATSQIQISPPDSIENIPSTKLWTNGNLLGLEPSTPFNICLPSKTVERPSANGFNNDVKSYKQCLANGQISQQMNLINQVQGPLESLCLADQLNLKSNKFLSKKYIVKENNSMKHSSAYLSDKNDGFHVQRNSQAQSKVISFNEQEESKVSSPNELNTSINQVHQITNNASSKESEPCSTITVPSFSVNSKHNLNHLSYFYELPKGYPAQGLQIIPTNAKSFSQYEQKYEQTDDDYSQSMDKSIVGNQGKRLNALTSQSVYEQKLPSQMYSEQSLTKTDFDLMEKPVSAYSQCSQNCSPPLEHMKLSFNPMNCLEASNLKLELPDGCINERIDRSMFPSFRLYPGLTLPAQDGCSESSDDSSCESSCSNEDLLSPLSESNSEFWEQDACSGSKTNELSDGLQRISSPTTCISSYTSQEQLNHVNQEIGLMDIRMGNVIDSFQPSYIANIPTFESLLNQEINYDSLSISLMNVAMLPPMELPPPPPLPPIRWRLARSLYEISKDSYSNVSQVVNQFEDSINEYQQVFVETQSINQRSPLLVKDEQCMKMQDNLKLDSLKANLFSNPYELDRREQLLQQIKDVDNQSKLRPCEDSKSLAASSGIDERQGLLHQIRTKTLNLRHAATTSPDLAPQPATNDQVAAILKKANALRQACATSEEDDCNDDDDWGDI